MHKQTGYLFGRRLTGLILSLSFLLSFFGVYATERSRSYNPVFQSDFEQCAVNGYYSNSVGGADWSYIAPASRVQTVGGASAISGNKSLQIQQCDLRWEHFKADDYLFKVAFSVRLDADFDQKIQFILSTQDPLTDLTSEVGVLLEIYNNEQGNTVLQGSDMTTPLAQLKKNETYHVEMMIERGSADVRIVLNGTELEKQFSYISKVYFVDGIRILSTVTKGATAGGSWYLDDISVMTRSRTFVQSFSGQTPGAPASVTLPEDISDELRVYVNGIHIGVTKSYASSQTVYISAEQFFRSINVPYTYDKELKLLTLQNERVSVRVAVPDTVVTVNDSTIALTYPVRIIDQEVMIPPQFINEVFNAKVWWDPTANLLVITTGVYKNNNKLIRLGSELYMNGEPFYSVGANEPDLFRMVMKSYLDPANVTEASWTKEAEVVLRDLSEQGVHSVRFLCSTDLLPDLLYDDVSMGKYLEAMDALLNVCDQYEIQAVLCLDLISQTFLAKENAPRYGWLLGDEHIIDLVSDGSSKSRVITSMFLEKFTTRYKDRSTILLYELADAGNLSADTGVFMQQATYSLEQLSAFYYACAAVIRQCDPDCILSSGDAAPLLYQWLLYCNTMEGKVSAEATIDLPDQDNQQKAVLWLLHSVFDIVSVQFDLPVIEQLNQFYLSNDAQLASTDLLWYIRAADSFGKPLYSGLSYGLPADASGDVLQENSMDGNLYKTVQAGIPLSYWQDLEAKEMNQGTLLLKATYGNNIAEAENTNVIWLNSNVDVFDPAGVISGDAFNAGNQVLDRTLQFVTISALLIVFSTLIVLTFKNKRGV